MTAAETDPDPLQRVLHFYWRHRKDPLEQFLGTALAFALTLIAWQVRLGDASPGIRDQTDL